jgi:hypothetical protein
MIVLVLAALLGGVLTSALLWAKAGALAIALAPVGGSLAAAATAGALIWNRRQRLKSPTLDEQIAALRMVAALGRRDEAQKRPSSDERAA